MRSLNPIPVHGLFTKAIKLAFMTKWPKFVIRGTPDEFVIFKDKDQSSSAQIGNLDRKLYLSFGFLLFGVGTRNFYLKLK